MTEPNQARELLAMLRDALHQLASTLDRTREGIGDITSQVARLHEGVEALCDLRQRENTAVGVDMLVDAAAELLAAFRALDAGILDAQAEVDTLEEAIADADGRDA
jgi:chromosome segregation ATPase